MFGLFIVNVLFHGKVLKAYWRRGIGGEVPSTIYVLSFAIINKNMKEKSIGEN